MQVKDDAPRNKDETRRVIELAEAAARQATPHAPLPVRTIAFFLPQFHPIPENDAWWGRGFTEWSNVTRAGKLFRNHYQPHLPTELGFYDLRVPEIREQQAQLAATHGIYGFCYHYFWFQGRRLLDRPLKEVLESRRPKFPFCVCWANENWTRNWDGHSEHVLLHQDYPSEDSQRFIEELLPVLRDDRYVRVNGKAVLLVYRVDSIPNVRATADLWREICYRNGIGELLLCAAQSFGIEDPTPYGFDAAVEFPPHGHGENLIRERLPDGLRPDFRGCLHDYPHAVEKSVGRPDPGYPCLRGIMPSWDNTARTGHRAHIFLYSSPELYEAWLKALVAQTSGRKREEDRLLFINAWNEWAEGCHLEPDQRNGRQYLEATKRVLMRPELAATDSGLHCL